MSDLKNLVVKFTLLSSVVVFSAVSLAAAPVAVAQDAGKPADAAKAGAAVIPGDGGTPAGAAMSPAEALALFRTTEDRMMTKGDLKAVLAMNVQRGTSPPILSESLVLRRDESRQFIILLTKPKTESGKGYLYRDKNFWVYEPSLGRWERRTERDRIGGTNVTGSDVVARRESDNYTVVAEADQKFGQIDCHVLLLTAKPDADVAYPVRRVWIDKKSGNTIKGQSFALSGKLLTTFLMPKWQNIKNPKKGSDVWFWSELHVFDEIQQGDATHILVKSVDLEDLPAETFSKPWLESKSR